VKIILSALLAVFVTCDQVAHAKSETITIHAPQFFPWLKKPIYQKLFELFEAEGGRLLCVGGAVRDGLIKRAHNDIDFKTDLPFEKIVQILRRLRLPVFYTLKSKSYHALKTYIHGQIIDIVSTSGRPFESIFEFSTSPIDKFFLDKNGNITSYDHGLSILLNLNTLQKFKVNVSDPMRFFKMHARYFPNYQLQGCKHEDFLGIKKFSDRKNLREFLKILSFPAPDKTVTLMQQTGFLDFLFEREISLNSFQKLRQWEKRMGKILAPEVRFFVLTEGKFLSPHLQCSIEQLWLLTNLQESPETLAHLEKFSPQLKQIHRDALAFFSSPEGKRFRK
jgi:tRNA nucleotidyltransferase/poly(A) polymerase